MAAQAQAKNPIQGFYHGVTLAESGRVKEIYTLTDSQTVEDAVNLFSKHHVLSAPVLSADGDLVGMVDMLDIANFVLKVVPNDDEIESGHLASLTMAGRAMSMKTLKDVMGASGRDPPVPLNQHNPSTMAVSMFSSGIHRCPITGDDEKIVGLVSQSSLLGLLSDQIVRGKLKVMGEKSLRELGLGQGGLVTAPLTDKVLSLIRKLDQNSVSAIGLTDEKGELAGNFSITDLRGLWQEVWPTFVLSAQEYLEKHHVGSLNVNSVSVDETNLVDLVKMMVDQKLHRVWTYEGEGDDRKAIGVISLTDLMRLFDQFELEV